MNLITTNEAAALLGVTRGRVVAMITAGRLPAKKIGRDWMINLFDLALVADRQPGYPRGRARK